MDKPARSPLLLPRAAPACREPLRRKDEAPRHSPTADGQLSSGLSTAGSPPLWIVGRRRRQRVPQLPLSHLGSAGSREPSRVALLTTGYPTKGSADLGSRWVTNQAPAIW